MRYMEDIKYLEWLEIFLWYKCNIKCKFCYQKDLRLEYKDNIEKSKVLNLLLKWYKEWKRFVIFSWGEPTLDTNLWYYIEYSRELWFEHIRVHTNGFMFKEYNYLEKLYKKWLTGVTISIHWYRLIHDKITRVKGSFDIILKALINFEKLKKIDNHFTFDTNTVISKENSVNLLILFKLLLKFNVTRRMLVYPYNINLEKDKLLNILPVKNNYIVEVEKILEFIYSKNTIDFVLETIPYCLINKKYWRYIKKNYKTDKETYFIEWKQEKNIQYLMWKIKYKECNNCLKNKICYWFSNDYNTLYWKPNFNPIIN